MEAPAGRERPEEAPATARRPLRADAQLNHDRLLEVAARHFAEDGSDASMKAIAREAGVGIGTLYRRFPSREILVEATYRTESRRLCEAAPALLREMPPGAALREWMRMFLGYMAAKRGMVAPGPAAPGAAAVTAGLSGAAAEPPSPGDRGKVHITDK